MVEVFKSGKMDLFMKEIGYKVKLQVMVDWYILVVIIIKVNGSIINVTVLENMLMQRKRNKKKNIVNNIMDIGKMIINKGKELKFGQIQVNIKEILRMVLKMDMVNLNGKMVVVTLVNLNKIKYLVEVNLFGVIKAVTMVNGKIILCMETVCIFFQMVEIILEIMLMASNKVLEHSLGLREENMQDNGKKESNMAKECIQIQEEQKKKEFGLMVSFKKQISNNILTSKQIDIVLERFNQIFDDTYTNLNKKDIEYKFVVQFLKSNNQFSLRNE